MPFARPHTNNVNEVREFVDRVCGYLDVNVVDVIAHSLGCSLVYAICRGLEKRPPPPVNFNQPKRWQRLGTFVALAGAFHGLGPGLATGEWVPAGEFMTELLGETEGGGGEAPHRPGQTVTPPPTPHNITYFCGIAQGDFVDASRSGTGRLTGAVNRNYSLGPSLLGHRRIKEDPVVFADFLPLLNTVPPAPPATLAVQPDAGSHANPLTATVAVTPATLTVEVTAARVTKAVSNGALAVTTLDSQHHTLHDGDTLTLSTDGQWELTFSAPGAVDDEIRTYWVGIPAVDATITTSNATPFPTSLTVMATTSNPRASLYHSLGGDLWNEGANISITDDAVVSFIAIDPSGVTSQIVSKPFRKARPTANAGHGQRQRAFPCGTNRRQRVPDLPQPVRPRAFHTISRGRGLGTRSRNNQSRPEPLRNPPPATSPAPSATPSPSPFRLTTASTRTHRSTTPPTVRTQPPTPPASPDRDGSGWPAADREPSSTSRATAPASTHRRDQNLRHGRRRRRTDHQHPGRRPATRTAPGAGHAHHRGHRQHGQPRHCLLHRRRLTARRAVTIIPRPQAIPARRPRQPDHHLLRKGQHRQRILRSLPLLDPPVTADRTDVSRRWCRPETPKRWRARAEPGLLCGEADFLK